MKHRRRIVLTAVVLLAVSTMVYLVHYGLFRDAHHILIYLVGDIAFVPLEVLLVVIVIEGMLERRDKAERLQKLNMLIGTFFSELGTTLLGDLTESVTNRSELAPHLCVRGDWTRKDYQAAISFAETFDYEVDAGLLDLKSLEERLQDKRDLLVMMLANPTLLEHGRFTHLLWAIFHLMEELAARGSFDELPKTDLAHLAGDVRRAYALLTREWLYYCRHVQRAYPYIFSIIVRTHPLQERPDAVVR